MSASSCGAAAIDPQARLRRWLDLAADSAILALLLLRPLVWSGDVSDPANQATACLAAGIIALGCCRLALGESLRWSWSSIWGAAFLGWAWVGAVRSPLPAEAWSVWSGWTLYLGAALVLAPRLQIRRDLVVAGVLASILGQSLIFLAQIGWERPAVQAELAADPGVAALRGQAAQLVERAHLWRLEGSFLLANTVAAWLILIIPTAVGAAWLTWRRTGQLTRRATRARWAVAFLALLGVAMLLRSGSKMGMVAMILAGAATAWLVGRRWRWLAGGLVLVMIALTVLMPGLRERIIASAEARIGYWQGAVLLVAERPVFGFGLDGFRSEFSRVKAPLAEETVYVHNEPLQAAVDLGGIGLILLLGWWTVSLLAMRPRREWNLVPGGLTKDSSADFALTYPLDGPAALPVVAPAIVSAGLVLYVLLVGGILGGRSLTSLQSVLLIAAVAVLPAALIVWLPRFRVPTWSLFAGVLACLVHACADFHLHSEQVVGVLAVLAMAAAPGRWQWSPRSRLGRFTVLGVGALVVLVTMGTMVRNAPRTDLRERAQAVFTGLNRLHVARQQTVSAAYQEWTQAGLFAASAHFPAAGFAGPQALAEAAVQALVADAVRWPAAIEQARLAAQIAVVATLLWPDESGQWLPALSSAMAQFPHDIGLLSAAADIAYQRSLHEPDDPELGSAALAWTRRALDQYPVYLPLWRRRAQLAEQAGLSEEVAQAQAAITRLQVGLGLPAP